MAEPLQNQRDPAAEFHVAWFLWFLSVIGFTLIALDAEVLSPYWAGRIMGGSLFVPLLVSWIGFRVSGRSALVASMAFAIALTIVCLGNLRLILSTPDPAANAQTQSFEETSSAKLANNEFGPKMRRLQDASTRLDHVDFLNFPQIHENSDYAWQLEVVDGYETAIAEALTALEQGQTSLRPYADSIYAEHRASLHVKREVAESLRGLLGFLQEIDGAWGVDDASDLTFLQPKLQQEAQKALDKLEAAYAVTGKL